MKKLLIISHTSHFRDPNGSVKGWGPTVREINFLATKYDKIIHIACFHETKAPESCIAYSTSNIEFIPIPPSGGKNIFDKIKSIFLIPKIIGTVNRALKNVDAIQLRVPTGMANYLLPFLTLKKVKQVLWVKYAGNWKQENAPLGYRFQRWWLTNNFLNCKVTINGKWEDQPGHCITFENPCLDEDERITGNKIINHKKYHPPYTACFIGRIETEKGVKRILDALPEFAKQQITKIHFIGNGDEINEFKKHASNQNPVTCIFHGSVDRNRIPEILIDSHFLLLPSTASEGFPKVIAEGMNYGAIPIVSDVSSIGQYINQQNGFVWNTRSDFKAWIQKLTFNEPDLVNKSRFGYLTAELFTFEKYYQKLKSSILNDN